MSTFRRRLMQKAKEDSILPEGCKRVFFLQANETQWIDTEHILQADEDFYIDFVVFDAIKNTNRAIMGWRWKGSYTNNYQSFINVNDSTANGKVFLCHGISSATIYTQNILGDIFDRVKLTISPSRKEILVNDEPFTGKLGWTDLYGGDYTNYLFNFNNIGTAPETTMANARIYEYWVKDINGNFVQHLIPIIDANGVACMYDIVSGKFHYNKGTGDFITPSGESYLVNAASAYIDTGVPLTEKLSYKIKFELNSNLIAYPSPIGAGISVDNRLEFIYSRAENHAIISRYGNRVVVNDIDIYATHIVKSYPDYYEIDGEMGYWDNEMLTPQGDNLYLFSTSRDTQTYFRGKIYWCRIYDGDTLIRDFVPHFQNNKWGMLDKVENKFYTAVVSSQRFQGYIEDL